MPTKPPLQSDSRHPKGAHAPHVDVARFRTDLCAAGVEDIIETLLQTFVDDAPARFAALEQAVAQGNPKAVESAAHAFKSGAGTIRATVLAEGLAQAEATGRAGNLQPMTALLEHIRQEYLSVVTELQAAPQSRKMQ
jgi:HPt (histidine-containing phosphotransfer) domain-containing protein